MTVPGVSLCMIVKDESPRLPMCLRSVEGLVDEIVLVDTGSTDGTQDLARSLGCRVFEIQWDDDFSKARNHALDQARHEWILVLDADEVLQVGEGGLLEGMDGDVDFGLVKVVTPGEGRSGPVEEWAVRLFRNRPAYRYRYPVHEQIHITGARGRETGISVLHLGAMDEVAVRVRQSWYLELLEALPDDHPHRLVFTVRGLVNLGRWEEAEAWARRALDGLPSGHSALPRVLFHGAVSAFNRQELDSTTWWLRKGLALFPEHPDLHFVAMAHEARLFKVAHGRVQDPGHPLFRKVGDSARWLPMVDGFLESLG